MYGSSINGINVDTRIRKKKEMKIFCIGRNYSDHAKEMNSPVPKQPMVFMKPPKNLHYEIEVVLRVCKNGRHVDKKFASNYYEEIGLGIDFTARDLQAQCKEKGHPWEIAKGFDGSACVSKFVSIDQYDAGNLNFSLKKNGELVQQGNTKDQIFDYDTLIIYLSKFFRLQIGDLIYTGTPAGVGPVAIGDVLEGSIEGKKMLSCEIK
jgi:2-keto-4-pentenoate hydratase/2-oxohepta-3-ene-1,7-dioic acid hydratase in catechol pathway